MGKTAAERKREQRERLKANGKFQSFKDNESKKQKERRRENKKTMTIEEKESLKVKKREGMRQYRAKKALKAVANEASTSFNPNLDSPRRAFKSPSSFGKAIAKVKRSLPQSPNKRKALVKTLAHQLVPEIVSPPPKQSRVTRISDEIKLQVESFFESDSISYQAPGVKDFVIIRDKEGKKTKMQKRYLFMTLGETYESFKNENADVNIGRSKFCELRPSHICLRHETPPNLCLCIYHENIRLLLEAMSIFPNYTSEFIKLIICDDNCEECFYQNCVHCGNLKKLHSIIQDLTEIDLKEEIKYSQWIKDETKVVTRQNTSSTLGEAVEKLEKKLPQFLQHVYIKRKQETFFCKLKENMPPNTLLLHFDFSENYNFIYQDEIQSAHWVSKSCTIYTAMAYFVDGKTCKSIPIVVVSDYLQHDKYAVATFNEAIIKKIKADYPELLISKLIYQSDGTAQHFKQKYSICIAMLQPEDVEWHFSATSHGKGPIDGVGGTLKRRVREATLSRQIDPHSAEEFFRSARAICPNVTILYISESSVSKEKDRIDKLCFPSGKEIFPIPETRKLHCFIKIKPYELKAANISLNPSSFYKINLINGNVELEEFIKHSTENSDTGFNVGNWVLIPFAGKRTVKYFAAQIISKETSSIRVKCLQWKGSFFIWPDKEDTSDVDIDKGIRKLPEPDFDRRLHFTFPNFDFSKYIMG